MQKLTPRDTCNNATKNKFRKAGQSAVEKYKKVISCTLHCIHDTL